MEEHFLTSEESLTNFLNTLCCKHCIFFIENKCTHENSVVREADKIDLAKAYEEACIDGWKATPAPVSVAREYMLNGFKERAEHIDEYFSCSDYRPK